MHAKHDKIRRLKQELKQLETWQEMGLVPTSHMIAHAQEIREIKIKINEENQKLQMLKEEQGVADGKPSRYSFSNNTDLDTITISEDIADSEFKYFDVDEEEDPANAYGATFAFDQEDNDEFYINNTEENDSDFDSVDDDFRKEDSFRWGDTMMFDDEESFE